VSIRGNTFLSCAEPVIHINPENSVPNDAVHQNIRIERNTFVLRHSSAVRAKKTEGLKITSNDMYPERKLDGEAFVKTDDCANVTIENSSYLPL
jgi:hypothetical protein